MDNQGFYIKRDLFTLDPTNIMILYFSINRDIITINGTYHANYI